MKYLYVSALFFVLCCANPQKTATLIFTNGRFFTSDTTQLEVTAVAIENDRIVYVGNDEGAIAYKGKNTRMVNLQGAFAMSGLIEGHGHFSSLGHSLRNLNLMNTTSFAQIRDLVSEKIKNTTPNTWIEGRGWHQEKWTEPAGVTVNGYPYHNDISAVSPNNPVVLYHASGHALLANAKAMELAGISAETPNPQGGRIVRDAAGRALGVFEENAMDLIDQPFNKWKNQRSEAERIAEFDTIVGYATRECLRRGITSFQDAGSSWWEIEQYQRLAQAGSFGTRLWAMIAQPRMSDLGKIKDFPKLNLGNNFFTVRAVKAYFDGALGSYGAWLLEPYSDKPDSYGQNTTPLDTIAAIAAACRDQNLQCCVHAIGDRGNREILNVFEKTGMKPDSRWRVEHAQHIDPADQPRFKQLGVIASMQAIHCTSDAPFVVKRLGETRARTGAYAWRSLLNSGAHISNGTDTPVEDVNPFPCLFASVTRQYRPSEPPFYPEQAMTRQEALLSYTIWNAYAAFEEKDKGSLAVGKLADIVILDRNILSCNPLLIPQTKVIATIVGGKTVYGGI
jgi:predicted amidohydrolase YtcJ